MPSDKKSGVSLSTTVVRGKDQVSAKVGDEVVILAIYSGEYYSLDGVGAYVWDLLQEPKHVKEILDAILEVYEVDPSRAERDLLGLLGRLAEEGLIEVRDEATP